MCSAPFFLKFFLPIEFPTSLQDPEYKGRDSIVGAVQIQGHLRNLNIDKSMEPDKRHPKALRELADISSSLSLLKSHDSQAKSPVSGKGEILHPFIKCV